MALGGESEDANYRQVGRGRAGVLTRGGTAGQLRRGELAFAPPPQTATIPSKYETVLFGGGAQAQKAREGFGSQASRFAGEAVNDNPGPGAYAETPSSLNRDAPSIGKRGYGNGFASRTQRPGVPGSAPARSQGPGPGSYDVSAYKATGADTRAMARPFAADKGGRALRPDGLTDESPGPARYKLGRAFDDATAAREQGYAVPAISGRVDAVGGGTSYRSVFAGKGPRFHAPKPSELQPGPGAYNLAPTDGGFAAPGRASLPSAAFRSGVSRTAERNGSARPPPREQALGIAPPPAVSQPASASAAAAESARHDAANPSPAFIVGITVTSHRHAPA
jgi:hypothetical protein